MLKTICSGSVVHKQQEPFYGDVLGQPDEPLLKKDTSIQDFAMRYCAV